jgi:hydroxymethylbilane synthase
MEGIKIASRESELAMVQARFVQGLIGGEIVGVTSEGDVNLTSPLYSMPGVGIFVKQLEIELLSQRADIAAHCLKDMPTTTTSGLHISAILPFTTPRGDIAIFLPPYSSLESLPCSSIIGTSSLRRVASIRHNYRHKSFTFRNIRGNLNTRVKKLENHEYDCIILAAAGIHRLGWQEKLVYESLDEERFLYAPGQAALALECREDDLKVREHLKRFDDFETRIRCEAEREFMKDLEGVRIS